MHFKVSYKNNKVGDITLNDAASFADGVPVGSLGAVYI